MTTETGRWVDPRCTALPLTKTGPFVMLGDGSLMAVEGHGTVVSTDDGRTWCAPRAICAGEPTGIPSEACAMLRTRDGGIVLVYMDMATYQWGWDDAKNEPTAAKLDVWAIRSPDEGKTWTDRQKLLDGYCGCLMDIIETRSGRVVVPVQDLLRNPARHAQYTFASADSGKTWKRSNVIDLGGHGHHDGAIEGTLEELKDGRLLMLLRTNLDRFWEAYSDDQGLSWRVIRPSPLDASSAPGYLKRLASGRLMLAWNRLYPEGLSPEEQARYPRTAGSFSERPASIHREELSIAFSEDEAKTWSKPTVIVREKKRLSYPFILERRPGELWVTTRFNTKLGISLKEADFVDNCS
ncbi:MAG: exo-alpha-sialidase [Planctomycetes bacterium]|nr:exo-alpha-sialidase [Planctomycetota bacterium]